MLLESGYPLELETTQGMTALMLASYHGHIEVVEHI